MNQKVQISADDMEALLAHAKQAGTIERWADLAITWMQTANAKIVLLEAELLEERNKEKS